MNQMVTNTAENPFGNRDLQKAEQAHSTTTSSNREIAEVQAAMAIAKRFPRNQMEAADRILESCRRPTLAASALYQYARGGTDVTGPSIRLAEAMANAWGNTQFGIRELEQRNGESTVEAFAWDVETNTRIVKVFQVPHIRHTRTGSKKLEDPRDIYEMVANQGARRLRACILGIIPGDVIDAAVRECESTLTANADTSPEAVARLVSAFGEYGVSREHIEERIQRRLESITPAQIVALRKIFTSLRDQMSAPADWFKFTDAKQAEDATSRAQQAAEIAKRRREEAQSKAREQLSDTVDTTTGEVLPADTTTAEGAE